MLHFEANPDDTMRLRELRDVPEDEQRDRGYYHTLREILQQPATWHETSELVRRSGLSLREGTGPVLLTGSGSSHYIGESLEPLLARSLGRSVRAVPAGALLMDFESYVFDGPPGTLVSFARSGDSPESCAVSDGFLSRAPAWKQVLVTCNREGALATRYSGKKSVSIVILPDRTNDRSLAMTSSFTNLWLAGRILGGSVPDVASLARAAESMFQDEACPVAEAGTTAFPNAVYLGSGARYGAAREAALKMLEMTDGSVLTFAESFLGVRHGPMCALRETTLLVGFLSRNEPQRSYERDLLREVAEMSGRPRTLLSGRGGDIDFDLDDGDDALLDVVVGQLLGFFRSLVLGLKPDAPSAGGVISRVVRPFGIHRGPH
jgi:tagatose-6-phosphate ketose/aldose isomerase